MQKIILNTWFIEVFIYGSHFFFLLILLLFCGCFWHSDQNSKPIPDSQMSKALLSPGWSPLGSAARRLTQPRPCVPRLSWFTIGWSQSSECLPSPSNVNTAFLTPPIVSGGKWPSIVFQCSPQEAWYHPLTKAGKLTDLLRWVWPLHTPHWSSPGQGSMASREQTAATHYAPRQTVWRVPLAHL